MPKLELADVPESVLNRLQEEAVRHGTSPAYEALQCLQYAVLIRRARATEDVLEDLRRFRDSLTGLWATEQEVTRARESGRA
jgi:hypothetical protein